MFYIIYKTICTINGKFYIGKHKTENLEDGYLGSGKLLRYAIKKYGKENFKREILQYCSSEEEMNEAEKNHVVLCEDSYNLCPGGEGGFGYINSTISKEIKIEGGRKGGLNNKGIKKKYASRNCSKETIEKYNKSLEIARKSTWSEEARAKRLETYQRIGHQRGIKSSQFGTCWMTNQRENIKVKKEEIDFYISLGYNKGRIMKLPV